MNIPFTTLCSLSSRELFEALLRKLINENCTFIIFEGERGKVRRF